MRTATTASLSGLVVLTGVIWITQALRQIDLLTSKGQTILIFMMMTGLALPSLVAIIAPVALFAGVLYTLNNPAIGQVFIPQKRAAQFQKTVCQRMNENRQSSFGISGYGRSHLERAQPSFDLRLHVQSWFLRAVSSTILL